MKKPTNEMLKRAVELEQIISSASAELSEIKAAAKEYGPFSTKGFIVDVAEITRESLAGLKEVTKFYTLEELAKHDLIKTTTYKTVKIIQKVA